MDDHALLESWRAGDLEAGAELLRRHATAVGRFLHRHLPSQVVDDALQDTFVACVERRVQLPATASFRAYLFGIARHRMLMQLRLRYARPEPGPLPETACPSSRGPSRLVARHRTAQRVLDLVRELPEHERAALELFYWDQLTTPEIAHVLGVPDATVRTRLARARERLRLALGDTDPRVA